MKNIFEEVTKKNANDIALIDQGDYITYEKIVKDCRNIIETIKNNIFHGDNLAIIRIDNQYTHILVSLALFKLNISQLSIAKYEEYDFYDSDSMLSINVDFYVYNISNEIKIKRRSKSTFKNKDNIFNGGLILKTSGTTGKSKIILYNQENFINSSRNLPAELKSIVAPFNFDQSLSKRLILRCLIGGKTIILNNNIKNNIIDCILEYKVTHLITTEFFIKNIIDDLNKKYSRIDHAQIILTSSMINIETVYLIKSYLTNNVRIFYGTSETGGISMTHDTLFSSGQYSCGKIFNGTVVQILDDNYKIVGPNAYGNIFIKSDSMFDKYLFDDILNKKSLINDFYNTGDYGKISEDGELIFAGRKDNLIIMNGIKIFPSEIEGLVNSYPGIMGSIAFPVKSIVHNQIPCLAIITNSNFDKTKFEKYCNEKLNIKRPRKFYYLKDFPRNQAGKILVNKIISEDVL
jgi:acyl-coenzyme A synthetase/AMP-(fatty) acid ligase